MNSKLDLPFIEIVKVLWLTVKAFYFLWKYLQYFFAQVIIRDE